MRSSGKSSWLVAAAIMAAASSSDVRAAWSAGATDRAWVNELQPGRKATWQNGEAQWKREQRRGKKRGGR